MTVMSNPRKSDNHESGNSQSGIMVSADAYSDYNIKCQIVNRSSNVIWEII